MELANFSFDQLTNRQVYDCMRFRYEEFTWDQQVPLKVFSDEDLDPSTIHVVGTNGDQLVAYARLYYKGDSVRIGWISVDKSVRGTGYGGRLMAHLVATGQNMAKPETTHLGLTALPYVVPFYERFGFKSVGERGDVGQPMSLVL